MKFASKLRSGAVIDHWPMTAGMKGIGGGLGWGGWVATLRSLSTGEALAPTNRVK